MTCTLGPWLPRGKLKSLEDVPPQLAAALERLLARDHYYVDVWGYMQAL